MTAPQLRRRLSIAIPTYDFSATIGATLDSILAQNEADVEIVILDSGTDDTAKIVSSRASGGAPIRYIHAGDRCGIDRDMIKLVELTRSEHVWLFSADDIMRPGAISQVMSLLEDHQPDVLLIRHSNCRFDMAVIHPDYPVLQGESRSFMLDGAAARASYFAAAQTTEALFSYMSGLVVRRDAWDALGRGKLFLGTCWSHAARLLSGAAADALRVYYCSDVLIDRRGDNDSFAQHGVVARYALAIEGYLGIVGALFGSEGPEMAHTRRILRKEFGIIMFLLAKQRCQRNPSEDAMRLDRLFESIMVGYCGAWPRRLIYRHLPPTPFLHLYRCLGRLYRLLR